MTLAEASPVIYDWRMKICLMTNELAVGGAERCLANLACALHVRGHSIQVISILPAPTGACDELLQQLKEHEILVEFLDCHASRHLWHARRKVQQILRAFAPDILQTFLYQANVLGAWSRSALLNLRHVIGIRVAEQRWLRNRFESLACRHAESVVCVSKSVAEHVHQKKLFARNKCRVIPNGIDLRQVSQIHPLTPKLPKRDRTRKFVVAVGRLDAQKGFDGLISHAAPFLQSHQHLDLLIVGDGPLKTDLQLQIERARLGQRIFLTGWQAQSRSIIAASEMLLLSSRWEGMPNVLIEAMSLRKPVVATRVEGVRELLQNDSQQIAEVGDFPGIWKKAAELLADHSQSSRCVEFNFQNIASNYSLEQMVDRYESLYSELCSGRHVRD
jgi:glycosyltransferase involved in cell wall biosynthesis